MKLLERVFKIGWFLFTVILAVATFVEQCEGKEFVYQYIYGSIAFSLFSFLFLFIGLLIVIKSKLYKKNIPLFLFMLSPLWLLLGCGLNCLGMDGKFFIYGGYVWFTVFFISYLCSKNGSFRAFLRKLSVLFAITTLAIPPAISQRTISEDVAKEMGKIVVEYDGRQAPLQSLCNDCLRELYGSDSYKQFSSVQVIMGWVLFPEDWIREPIMKVPNRVTRQKLHCGKYVAPIGFFTPSGDFTVSQCPDFKSDKQLLKLSQKLTMLQLLRLGTPFRIFPKDGQWLSSADDLSNFSYEEREFCMNFFNSLYQNTLHNDSDKNILLIHSVQLFQETSVISPAKIKTELCYNGLRPWLGNPFAHLLLAVIAFFCFVKQMKKRWIWLTMRILAIVFSAILLFHGIVRFCLSGHLPLSNGYETLLFLSLLIILITSILWNKSRLIPFAGFLLSGLSLLAMNFSFNSPKISVLSSALDSPWLSLHVTTIMAAYSLLAFTFVLALLILILKPFNAMNSAMTERVTTISRVLLLPGIGLLAIGIMLGSVWGDSAWESYWSWDPKEVWALITLLFYAPAAQPSFFRRFQNPTFYHAYLLVAFVSLLVTYFGVNIWFGGLHAYQ